MHLAETLAEVYGRFWKVLEVLQSGKMLQPRLQLGVQGCGSVSPVYRFVELYLVVKFYTNVMNLHRQSASHLSEKYDEFKLFFERGGQNCVIPAVCNVPE